MSWLVEDRRNVRLEAGQPLLTDALKRHLADVYFPRYPTKRACLLPALHLVQHEYGWIPPEALREVGDYLEIAPAEVLDTASFYEEYWLRKKGKYLVQVCRSLACEIVGADGIIEGLIDKLGIEVGETTEDERFTLVELECLGSCGTAPVALVNDVLHEEITLQSISGLIDQLPDDPHDYHDPTIDFDVPHGNPPQGTYVDLQGATQAVHQAAGGKDGGKDDDHPDPKATATSPAKKSGTKSRTKSRGKSGKKTGKKPSAKRPKKSGE